jgi:hypothetical protein
MSGKHERNAKIEYPRDHPYRMFSFYIDTLEKPVLGFL